MGQKPINGVEFVCDRCGAKQQVLDDGDPTLATLPPGWLAVRLPSRAIKRKVAPKLSGDLCSSCADDLETFFEDN